MRMKYKTYKGLGIRGALGDDGENYENDGECRGGP